MIGRKSIRNGDAAILVNAFTVVSLVISFFSLSRNIGKHTLSSP